MFFKLGLQNSTDVVGVICYTQVSSRMNVSPIIKNYKWIALGAILLISVTLIVVGSLNNQESEQTPDQQSQTEEQPGNSTTNQEDQSAEPQSVAPGQNDDPQQLDNQEQNTGNTTTDDNRPPPVVSKNKVDDWQYTNPVATLEDSASIQGSFATSSSATRSIGLAVGGAGDINNYRRNINNNYLPLPSDITHEGLFYDYFFETTRAKCKQLFCPAYAAGVSPDPFSKQDEYFLAVGLDSNIEAKNFKRNKLNLSIVLDISGSMTSAFDRYHYDRLSGGNTDNQMRESKMQVAREAVVSLVKQLRPDDRLGIVLFDNDAYVVKPMNLVGQTDMAAIEKHILEDVVARGGTNMEAGYEAGAKLLQDLAQTSNTDYDNRIIFLTDAIPNTGATGESELAKMTAAKAKSKIYTTFVGIGVDFNSQLVQKITQTRGANYLAVHSSQDFRKQLKEGFEYMVTPLVFDLNFKLKARGYNIKAIYGSAGADTSSGNIMNVNTLFPSLRVEGETRGGVILLHLEKTSASNANLSLEVSYKDRQGKKHSNKSTVVFNNQAAPYYANSGVRKAIALSRMVNLLQNWLKAENQTTPRALQDDVARIYRHGGIPIEIPLGQWERTSQPLRLSSAYRPLIEKLKTYLEKEIQALGDQTLNREIEMLKKILQAPEQTANP